MKVFLKRQWPLLGIGILLVLFCFYLLKSGGSLTRDRGEETSIPGEGLRLNDFHFVQNNPDKDMTWTIDAKAMRSSQDGSTFDFADFIINLTPKESPSFQLSGRKGNYSRDSGEITLEGNLVGVSENGYRLVTERMRIHEKKKLITTDMHEQVKLVAPLFSVTGQGLSVDLEKETAKIGSNVTAVIYEDPSTG